MAKIYILARGTDHVVDEIDVGDPPYIQLREVIRGLRLQMDHELYYLHTNEVDEYL